MGQVFYNINSGKNMFWPIKRGYISADFMGRKIRHQVFLILIKEKHGISIVAAGSNVTFIPWNFSFFIPIVTKAVTIVSHRVKSYPTLCHSVSVASIGDKKNECEQFSVMY